MHDFPSTFLHHVRGRGLDDTFSIFLPIFPFIYLLFQEGVNIALKQVKARLFSYFLLATVLVMCMANFSSSKYEHYKYLGEKEGASRRIREFGEWLKQSFPSHYTVAYEEAGIPMYYSGLRLLDILGFSIVISPGSGTPFLTIMGK